MGKCDYILTLKGKDKVFKSYSDLFNFLIDNRNAINYGYVTDIVYSLDKQKELEAKLKNISGKTKELVVEGVDKITDDLLYKKEDGVITVSDLMKNPESLLNNPFNIDDYKQGDYDTEVAYTGIGNRVLENVVDSNKAVSVGRGTLSTTSINLPRLGIKHGIISSDKADEKGFFTELEEKLDLVKDQLLERYEIQCKKNTYKIHECL